MLHTPLPPLPLLPARRVRAEQRAALQSLPRVLSRAYQADHVRQFFWLSSCSAERCPSSCCESCHNALVYTHLHAWHAMTCGCAVGMTMQAETMHGAICRLRPMVAALSAAHRSGSCGGACRAWRSGLPRMPLQQGLRRQGGAPVTACMDTAAGAHVHTGGRGQQWAQCVKRQRCVTSMHRMVRPLPPAHLLVHVASQDRHAYINITSMANT